MRYIIRILDMMALTVVLLGCSHAPSSRQRTPQAAPDFSAYRTPTNLANQIAGADLIIVTNANAEIETQYAGFSRIFLGDDAKRLVRAISSARCYTLQVDPGWLPDWELQFYRGAKRLASVNFIGDGFCYGEQDGQRQIYDDETGALGRIYQEITARIRPLESKTNMPPNTALEPTPTAP